LRLHLETTLPCSYERAVEEVKKPRLLMHIARPLLRFEPAKGTVVLESWEEETYWFRLFLFGVIPIGNQAVRITMQDGADTFRLRDNGCSRMIRRWDHRIAIRDANGATIYSDTVDLDAGLLTPVVWMFVRLFFVHRQKRWRQLARSGFRDLHGREIREQ
jgi:hypothetical protein